MPDKGIKTGREGAGAVVSGKPLYNGRRKPAELVPAGTTAALDHKVLKTTVAFGTLVLPQGKSGVGNAVSKIGKARIQCRFEEHPLIRHPYSAVPVAVTPIVRRTLIHGGKAAGTPQVFRALQLLPQKFLLRFCTGTCKQRRSAIHAHIVVQPLLGAQNICSITRRIVQEVPEVTAFLVPCSLQGAPEAKRIGIKSICVGCLAQQAGGVSQDLCAAYRMGSCDHGRAAGLQTAAMDLLLWGVIVPSTGIIEIIPGAQQAAVQVGGSGAAFLPGEEAVVQL